MRLRTGAAVAGAALFALSACTSSGGGAASGALEVRAVIMPAQHVATVQPGAFAAVHVPADEDAYSRLTPAQHTQLVNALRGVDCAHPPALPKTDVRVVCDAYSYAYLVGPAIFTAHDVRSAAPIAPTRNGVTPQWRIALSLSSSGGDRMWDWTSQHHTDFPDGVYTVTQTSAKPPCGESVKTPCSDFLAYISDDVVVSVPVTFDPFRTAVLLSGDFTKASATRLAHKMTG